VRPGVAVAVDRALARALCGKAADGVSGIATATRGKLRRLFCLDRGWLVYATSNVIEEQFLEYLVRSGRLDPAARAEANARAAETGTPVLDLLRAAENPGEAGLKLGMEALVEELFASTMVWPDGAVTFAEGVPKLDGEVTVRLSPLSLALRHARREPPRLDQVRIRIGPPDLRPVQTDAAARLLDRGLDEKVTTLLNLADGQRELGQIVAASGLDEESALRSILALLQTGLLEAADPRRRAAAERRAREVPLSRAECLARLAAAAGDYYAVLGIERETDTDGVREAYYALARRYHPDRFRAGDLADLLPRFETFFTSVTESYNTLVDPRLRAEYDASLAAPQEQEGPKQSDTSYLARQNFLRGRALLSQRKQVEAVQFLENAARLDGGVAEYQRELGLLLAKNPRRREDAERALLRAIELAPTDVTAYVALAQLYQRAGRAGPALRVAREALRWEPDHAEAKTLLESIGDVPDEPSSGLFQPIFRG
jgi:curved DNA-binding protein CbpA